MPDYQTIYDDSAFQKTTATILNDNSSGDISAQDMRDLYATLRDRDRLKALSYSSTATLTIDLSAGPVQNIVLAQNITAINFVNRPPFNLLWGSENVTDGHWSPGSSTTIGASNVEDPFGQSTADRLVMIAGANTFLQQAFEAQQGAVYTWNLYAKRAGGDVAGRFDLTFSDTNAVIKSQVFSASTTWGFYETTWTANVTATRLVNIDNVANTIATDIYVARMGLYGSDKTDYVKTNPQPNGEVAQVQLYLQQDDAGSRTVSWGPRVFWENSATPTLSTTANTVDCVTLVSVNGGATWRATFNGQGWGG